MPTFLKRGKLKSCRKENSARKYTSVPDFPAYGKNLVKITGVFLQ